MSYHPHGRQIKHLDVLQLELELYGKLMTEPESWVAPIIKQAVNLGMFDKALQEIDRQRTIYRELKASTPKSKMIDMLGGVGHESLPEEVARKKPLPSA